MYRVTRRAWTFTASVLLMTVASGCIDDQSAEDPSSWRLYIRHHGGNETPERLVPLEPEDAESHVPFLVEAIEKSLQQEVVVIEDREQVRATETYLDDLDGRGVPTMVKFEHNYFRIYKLSVANSGQPGTLQVRL